MSQLQWFAIQVAAQVKQLELKLITLREELAQKERQARQAEFTVRDLKMELENLQVTFCLCHSKFLTAYPVQDLCCMRRPDCNRVRHADAWRKNRCSLFAGKSPKQCIERQGCSMCLSIL